MEVFPDLSHLKDDCFMPEVWLVSLGLLYELEGQISFIIVNEGALDESIFEIWMQMTMCVCEWVWCRYVTIDPLGVSSL